MRKAALIKKAGESVKGNKWGTKTGVAGIKDRLKGNQWEMRSEI